MLQLTKKLYQFKIHILISFPATGLFLLGLAKNSCQEWTTLAKKDSFNNFSTKY